MKYLLPPQAHHVQTAPHFDIEHPSFVGRSLSALAKYAEESPIAFVTTARLDRLHKARRHLTQESAAGVFVASAGRPDERADGTT